MNHTSSFPQEYLDLAPHALAGECTPEQQARFEELLAAHPACAADFAAQRSTLHTMQSAVYPVHSSEYWSSFADTVVRRIGAKKHTATPQVSPRLLFTLPRPFLNNAANKISMQRIVRTATLAAAAGIAGFVIGRWSLLGTSIIADRSQAASHLARGAALRESDAQSSPQNEAQDGTLDRTHDEVQDLLQQSHLLFVGVMNMSAECNVSNPKTLAAQRKACIALLFKTQQVRQLQGIGHKPELMRLLGEIEATLAEIAAVEPGSLDAGRIRAIQSRSDYTLCELSSAVAALHSDEYR
jgi:hypothetical protein